MSKVDESRKRAKTGGRTKGTPNKATASLKDMARQYTSEAIEVLHTIATDGKEPAAARISAANSLLDRGYGRPSQVLSGDEDGGPISLITRMEIVGVRAESSHRDPRSPR